MRNNPVAGLIIFSVILLIIDFYSYWGITKIIRDLRQRSKKIIRIAFWIVPIFVILGMVVVFSLQSHIPPAQFINYFYFISGPFILFYVPKLVFIIFNLFDDVIFLIRKFIFHKVKKADNNKDGKSVTRRKFLNQLGIAFAAVPFISLFYGITYGRFNFTVRKFELKYPNLPEKFNGFKIVQISDFHIGSFLDYNDVVKESVNIINEQKADLLLFTGDFVNNVSSELDPFMSTLKSLKAKTGKFSVLGNHDYGDYVRWNSIQEKQNNLKRLVEMQRDLGFDLLLNESRRIELGDQKIELLGIENWGLPPFPQYGDLNKTLKNVNPESFKILMSHDPTHFNEQVFEKTDIDLTLSGHTHGAQFGIEIPGWRWSPVTLRYKHWGGLYNEGSQKIYVNTGIGFIGFPGRVGMPPEITVFELYRD